MLKKVKRLRGRGTSNDSSDDEAPSQSTSTAESGIGLSTPTKTPRSGRPRRTLDIDLDDIVKTLATSDDDDHDGLPPAFNCKDNAAAVGHRGAATCVSAAASLNKRAADSDKIAAASRQRAGKIPDMQAAASTQAVAPSMPACAAAGRRCDKDEQDEANNLRLYHRPRHVSAPKCKCPLHQHLRDESYVDLESHGIGGDAYYDVEDAELSLLTHRLAYRDMCEGRGFSSWNDKEQLLMQFQKVEVRCWRHYRSGGCGKTDVAEVATAQPSHSLTETTPILIFTAVYGSSIKIFQLGFQRP